MKQIDLGNITVDVELKNIKNIHLSVYPPNGRVRIAAPLRFDMETIRMFAISKLSWIKKQQIKFQKQVREPERRYKSRENHYYLGKRYLLQIVNTESRPSISIKHDKLVLGIRADASIEQKQLALQKWYRDRLKELIPKYIVKWEKLMHVQVAEVGIKKMKTKWGTCNIEKRKIWINLELAKKPLECLEYIVVHEMVHLLERNHNERYIALMDKFLPQWKHYREELNRLPLSHIEWNE